jgi:formyl-CoA transferase|tara:strand:- start:3133 stop:4350 length:1218 start_codon:yes stop_codon:yes gene_type:complete
MAALDGMKVLDMTQYEAGTSCTQALAWLGADVVKIEAPQYGDPGRGVGRTENQDYSAYFCAWNANKRSIALDLSTDEGHDLFMKLVPNFDVFVENYGPGVIEKLNIGYQSLRDINPGLIYARIKGFGTSGPYSDYRCMDMIAQAAAGAFSLTGEADGPPMMPGSTTGDAGTGVQTAMAILAAYVQKQRTGEGQEIEVSMQEAMTYYIRTRAYIGSAWGTQAAPRSGNAGGLPPVNIYPCKPFGPNDYIYLMPVNQDHLDALFTAMDRADLLVDPRFETMQGRWENGPALHEEVSKWTGERTKHEAMETIASAGVPCSACLDTSEIHHDKHLTARGFIHEMELPVHGKVPMLGFAPRLSESKVDMQRPPHLGEHTDKLLTAELGMTADEITTLRDAGVIGDANRFS